MKNNILFILDMIHYNRVNIFISALLAFCLSSCSGVKNDLDKNESKLNDSRQTQPNTTNHFLGDDGNDVKGFDLSDSIESLRKLDPGLWTGTWLPYGTDDFWVVDQSTIDGKGLVSYLPSCVNQRNYITTRCKTQKTYTESIDGAVKSLNLRPGTVISMRFLSSPNADNFSHFVRVKGGDGGNIGFEVTVSVSLEPGDFSNLNCTNKSNRSVFINLGLDTNCPINPHSLYYVNFRPEELCNGTCVLAINESSILNSFILEKN